MMIGRVAPIALILLSACSMVPHYARPAPPVPAQFPTGNRYPANTDTALPSLSYRDVFRDPRLQALIEQALANNRDLRIAAANIAAARAQYRITRAEQLPTIGSAVSVTESDSGTGRTNTNGSPVVGGARTNFNVATSITAFEIDLFGRVAALTQAQQARYFATEATARATRLTLIGDIASGWLRHATDQSLFAIAEQTVASANQSVSLTRARLDGGIAPRTDLAQAQTVLATAEADLALQKTAIAQDINALRLLLGADIDPALLPGSIDDAAPTIAQLPIGLDSGVLLRRPDIVAAEYQLRAANADVGAARAALFPRISITTVAGLASNGLSRLFTGGAFNYTATPGISYPIFAGGAAKAGVAQARAQFDAAVASYEKAVQTGFSEVADALARRETITEQLGAQQRLTTAAADNFTLSDARYRGGIATFLESLDAQRSLYTARRSLANARLIEAANLVTLYRTLGGDALIDATKDGPVAASQSGPRQ